MVKRFRDFYSLQFLGSVFLIWMEHHGRFANCDLGLLNEVKEIATSNIQATKFRPLEDEGHDTYLLGQNYSFFGNLSEISKTLVLRIEKSINSNGVEDIDTSVWESSVEKTKTGSELVRPSKAHLSAYKKVPNTDGKSGTYATYTIDVQWSGVKRWNVDRRFTEWNILKDSIDFEFKHVNVTLSNVVLKKSSLGDMVMKVKIC